MFNLVKRNPLICVLQGEATADPAGVGGFRGGLNQVVTSKLMRCDKSCNARQNNTIIDFLKLNKFSVQKTLRQQRIE